MRHLLLVCVALCAGVVGAEESVKLVEVRKIWDQAPHNAFTGLARFQDRWFCAFREGTGHVCPEGSLRVITSEDGKTWESVALLTSANSDLRDAQLTVTCDGRLMLSGAEAMHDRSEYTHQSLSWLSKDGRTWNDRNEIGDRNFWMWRVTWHKGMAYGIGYGVGKEKGSLRLYTSKDGKRFETLMAPMLEAAYPNETSLVFDGDKAYCLLRQDPANGQLGIAEPPYTSWEWKDIGTRIGGPAMLQLPDGRFVAGVRLYDGGVRTSLGWIDPASGKFTEFLRLPSGGDTSYPGLVYHDGLLWMSYYSSHEGKSNIYLAKVRL
ncbi:MAG: exo-alpha-sialidase [Thermoguttaceae bacterium]|jgi:hypothetical protein|nr:exo-alpha-sialidase [Thermoguttaceae bacterium]